MIISQEYVILLYYHAVKSAARFPGASSTSETLT